MTPLENLRLISHPILSHKLALMRDETTQSFEFRHLVAESARILCYEAMRDLKLKEESIKTPMAKAKVEKIAEDVILVSILRAGNAMLDGILEFLPMARAGHIGIYRDKFIKNTVEYYFKLPQNADGKRVFLLDPMIATGDTTVAAIDRLKSYDVGKISLLTILTSERGAKTLETHHPDVSIWALGVENELSSEGLHIPGMGDAGDRLYGTK